MNHELSSLHSENQVLCQSFKEAKSLLSDMREGIDNYEVLQSKNAALSDTVDELKAQIDGTNIEAVMVENRTLKATVELLEKDKVFLMKAADTHKSRIKELEALLSKKVCLVPRSF